MITIKDALGKDWKNIELHDDDSPYGGTSYHKETLDNFMAEVEIDEDESIGNLQKVLKECGIMEIEDGNRYVEEILQQKIWDIEEELGIDIVDYRWDYK